MIQLQEKYIKAPSKELFLLVLKCEINTLLITGRLLGNYRIPNGAVVRQLHVVSVIQVLVSQPLGFYIIINKTAKP